MKIAAPTSLVVGKNLLVARALPARARMLIATQLGILNLDLQYDSGSGHGRPGAKWLKVSNPTSVLAPRRSSSE